MIVSVVRALPGVISDPVPLLRAIARGPFSFLLESAAGDHRWARYTIMGTEPREAWRYTGTRVDRWTAEDRWHRARDTNDPIGHAGALMRAHEVESTEGMPPFFGGAVGFFGYDVVRSLERLPGGAPHDLAIPDALVLIADLVIVLDRAERRASIIATIEVPETACPEERAGLEEAAQRRIDALVERLADTVGAGLVPARSVGADPVAAGPVAADLGSARDPARGVSRTTDDDFMAGVRTIKEHIAAGDIFQGVLSRRIEVEGTVDALHLYRCMREMNPAPYLYCLQLDDMAIVGGSPEVLVRVADDVVTVRPIAGTRPRGGTPEEDEALARELLADPKECAEHRMLVDLGRNDVGRVVAYGSVAVADSMVVERYAHVQHIVSEVRGRLAPGLDAVDALKACFPAGTVTGAPKVRAMEILAGLEPVRRGPYAGAVGYLGWGARSLDTAITIRTCVVLGDRVIVQAGAGIVADSDPVAELRETEHKARGALLALARARAAGAAGAP